MKRIALPGALCLLAACTESATVVAPDLMPEFASTAGDPTWYFGGVVDGQGGECTVAEGMTFTGSVTFDDDVPSESGTLSSEGTRMFYPTRLQWHLNVGGLTEEGSLAVPCDPYTSECAWVSVYDGWFDEDDGHYWDAVAFTWSGRKLMVGAYGSADLSYVEGFTIPSEPPVSTMSTFTFPCPTVGERDVRTAVEWVSLVAPPEPPVVSEDPATTADCMKGGWEGYGFRNQGQCIRFVKTGKDSR